MYALPVPVPKYHTPQRLPLGVIQPAPRAEVPLMADVGFAI